MRQQKKGKEKASTKDGGIKDLGKSRKGWSDIEKDYLLDLLLTAIRNDEVDGIQSISSVVWNSITTPINKKFRSNYNKNQVCEQ
ncbi:hypothetical protein AXF42_Ash005017 [Apostasia shenzhenica]|uniref:Uncharacterized protein n=1 Tax=Apostasia shenzhenica TaxID=1088818 RepID=A0A2I0B877_9ASPA|nr:hypothetical protein AXF42_Ash005017 [Apostasia shenzhenica]